VLKYVSININDVFTDKPPILSWVGQKSYTIMDRYIGISDDYSDSEMTKVFDVMEASTK
jgi:hypothetical protein